MSKKIKILILSRTPWREDNSFGSSYSNIFGNIDEFEIANIYCGQGVPDTNVPSKFFQINEKMLIHNLIHKKNKSGIEVSITSNSDVDDDNAFNAREQKILKYTKKNRFQVFLWLRDLLWFLGRWNSIELNKFIDDFEPDLIFLPVYYWPYMNKIGLYVKKYSSKKMVGYISDDNYSLKQYSLNPLYWIDRLIKRKFVKSAIDQCEILYVISNTQKMDYDKYFQKNCKILSKGGEFNVMPPKSLNISKPISLLYTGNIGDGRYKTLALIGESLENINKNGVKAILTIYTGTILSENMRNCLKRNKSVLLHGPISSAQVKVEQSRANVLVHVESLGLKERLLVRHSFSTKIVDYFQAARCIFAIGWDKAASIDYLIKNDAAIVVTNEIEVEMELKKLIDSPRKLIEYGEKAWRCGGENHKISEIQGMLINDFNKIINR